MEYKDRIVEDVVRGVVTVTMSSSIGDSWDSYWSSSSKVLFFGEVSEITDNKLYNKVIGSSDYLTIGGVEGSYTFQCPDNATYIAADSNYIWFDTDGVQRTPTEAELVSYDLSRTPVKYDNTSPYYIRWIIILKAGAILTTTEENNLRDSFHLSVWWSDVLSFHGNIKGNRLSEKSIWINTPSDLALTLISGGVQIDWSDNSIGAAETEIWGQSDGAEFALLYTITAGTETKNETIAPVDLRYYKIRSKINNSYSYFTEIDSIAMLGPEVIIDGTFNTACGVNWTCEAGWASGTGNAVATATIGYIYQYPLTVDDTYKTIYTVSDYSSGTIRIRCGTTSGITRSADGTYEQTILCATHTVFYIDGVVEFTGEIGNVSCKKILFP